MTHQDILSFLHSEYIMNMAVIQKTHEPWIASVFYLLWDNRFYFLSSPSSIHGLSIHRNDNRTAVCIHNHSFEWENIVGLQMSGVSHILSDSQKAFEVLQKYFHRFPQAKTLFNQMKNSLFSLQHEKEKQDIAVFEFLPELLKITNNSEGFGAHQHIAWKEFEKGMSLS